MIVLMLSGALRQVSFSAMADEFRRLSAAQIRAKLIGMQFTDEVHWGEVYWPDGKLTSDEMGVQAFRPMAHRERSALHRLWQGGWKRLLEVWMSGRSVQLRTPGSTDFPAEGVLEKAPARR